MIKQFIFIIFLVPYFTLSLLAQKAEKKTAFSIELTPTASFYSTYKNWTRNNQLGIGMTFRHYRPIAENKHFSKRSFLLDVGIYYHEYFVPNIHFGLGYEIGNTIKKSRWIYQLYGVAGVGRAQLIDEYFIVEDNALKSKGALNRWHFQPKIGATFGFAIGKKTGFQCIPKIGWSQDLLFPYKTEDGRTILKGNMRMLVGLEFNFKTK